jgi:hypothetical protein
MQRRDAARRQFLRIGIRMRDLASQSRDIRVVPQRGDDGAAPIT